MDVYLSSESFVSLVASAAEGIPMEVLGLLFGDYIEDDDESRLIVSQAIPLQIAERGRDSVEPKRKNMKRVFKLWDDLTTFWPVGDFHSHPYDRKEPLDPTPSKQDKRDLKKGDLGIIVAIKKNSERSPLRYDRSDNRIIGNVSYFEVEVAAWYKNNRGRLEELELYCPYVDIINLGYKVGLVRKPGKLFGPNTVVSFDELRELRKLIINYETNEFKTDSPTGNARIKKEIIKILKGLKRDNDYKSE